jgi:hypothetical protein
MNIFTDFTNNYLEFFYNHKFNLSNDLLIIKQLKHKKKQIEKIYNNLHSSLHFNLHNRIDINKFNNKIKEYSNNKWVDPNVINKLLPEYNIITWKYNNITNYIYINSTKESFIKFYNRIKYIISILEFIRSNKTPYTIYLVLTDLIKKLPKENNKITLDKHRLSNETIGVANCNSGYCDPVDKYIFIWRLEEYEKVLFHEAIHFMDHDERNKKITLDIKINGPKSYYEAITDCKAIQLHLIYISLITHKSIKTLFEIELAFIRNQSDQIFKHFKLNKNWDNIIYQKTPAFSYYILKYLLFLKLIKTNNDNANYSDLIITLLNEKYNLYNYINNCDSSQRMTLFQLDS